mgnify:CR=1 FL=1
MENKTPSEALGLSLREHRTTAGYGVRELAAAMDVSSTVVSQMERGRRCTPENVELFARTIKVSPSKIIRRAEAICKA